MVTPQTKKARRPSGHRACIAISECYAPLIPCERQLSNVRSIDFNRCYRPKDTRLGKRRDARVVITERLAQDFLRMLTQQGGGDGIDDRCQTEIQRCFNIGNASGGRVCNLADAMALAHLRRIESFLD